MHPPTGIDNCASGFITHSPADFASRILPVPTDDIDPVWPSTPTPGVGPIPNLIVTAANVLEVYTVRVQEDGNSTNKDSSTVSQPQRGGVMAGLSGASLELVCSYRYCLYFQTYRITLNSAGVVKKAIAIQQIDRYILVASLIHLLHC